VSVFRPVRFLSPPSEPDVRVSTHPALHEFMPPTFGVGPAGHAARTGPGPDPTAPSPPVRRRPSGARSRPAV